MRLLSQNKEAFIEILKLGRLQLYPIMFLTLLVGAASVSEITLNLFVDVFLVSILVNYVSFAPNEYFDFEIDRSSKRKEIMGVRISNKRLAKFAATSIFSLGFIASFLLPDFAQVSFLVVAVASLLYSVPPFRFKGRAPLDSLCNIVGLYFIFAIGVGLAGETFSSIIPGAFWFSLIVGGGGHAILAIPDIEVDSKEGLRTMPMLLGKRNTVILAQALTFLALIFEEFSKLTQGMLLGVFIGLFYLWKERTKEELTRFIVLGVILAILYLAAYILTRGII